MKGYVVVAAGASKVDAMVVWRSLLRSWLLLLAAQHTDQYYRVSHLSIDAFGNVDRVTSEEMLTAFCVSR